MHDTTSPQLLLCLQTDVMSYLKLVWRQPLVLGLYALVSSPSTSSGSAACGRQGTWASSAYTFQESRQLSLLTLP